VAELRARDLEEEAAVLEAEIRDALAAHGRSLSPQPGSPAEPRLPAKCPYCGGSVLASEVEWIDERSAICDYCGSPLQAQG
jgi:ribosomal protein S27AE